MEVVRRAYDAYQRLDLEAFVALHHPQCEISPMIGGVEGGTTYRGHEGVRAYWADMHAAFEAWRPEAEEIRDHGDAIVIRVSAGGRGRDSGVPIAQKLWQVVRVREGRAAWWASYLNEEEALEAAGSSE